MSLGPVRENAAAKKAEARAAEHAHELALQKQMLDWIAVNHVKSGNVLVMRVPDDQFIHPGTAPEDMTDVQKATMETCHQVLLTLIENLAQTGIRVGGAAIMAEGMRLEDLPPPTPPGQAKRRESGLVLPPGTRI